MDGQALESLVTYLVRSTCDSSSIDHKDSVDELKRYSDILATQLLVSLRCSAAAAHAEPWPAAQSPQPRRLPPEPPTAARWRESSDREVLAPLAVKLNADNILAGELDMSRKRKPDAAGVWVPNKRSKLESPFGSCNVVIKRSCLEVLLWKYKCGNKLPYVKLSDVWKDIPQAKQVELPPTKDNYMQYLNLQNNHSGLCQPGADIKVTNTTKLMSHPSIPFSSDYGRRLLARERHCLSPEVALRKLERTEWYLKNPSVAPSSSSNNNMNLRATYDKTPRYSHVYKFGKRQNSQNHQSLQQAFQRYLCKPLYVVVEPIDASQVVGKADEIAQVQQTSEYVNYNNEDASSDAASDPSVVDTLYVSFSDMKLNGSCISVTESKPAVNLNRCTLNELSDTNNEEPNLRQIS